MNITSMCSCFRRIASWLKPESTDSSRISKKIKDGSRSDSSTIQLMLLGLGGSGKSTFIRNLLYNYGRWDESFTRHFDAFPEETRQTFMNPIRNNIITSFALLMTSLDPDAFAPSERVLWSDFLEKFGALAPTGSADIKNKTNQLGTKSNEAIGQYDVLAGTLANKNFQIFENYCKISPNATYLPRTIAKLWALPAVQEAFVKRHLIPATGELIIDSLAYFIEDRLDIVFNEDYIPSVEDILHCRIATQQCLDYCVRVHDVNFKIRDVGGDKHQRGRLIVHIEDFARNVARMAAKDRDHSYSSVIFMVSLADYNIPHPQYEDSTLLNESLQYFRVLLSLEYFKDTYFIIFFNKVDVFHEKLCVHRDFDRLGDNCPGINQGADGEPNFRPALLWAELQVQRQFVDLYNDVRPEVNFRHPIFIHFTCATDVTAMPAIFGATKYQIVAHSLMNFMTNQKPKG